MLDVLDLNKEKLVKPLNQNILFLFQSDKMLTIIEKNEENLRNSSKTFICDYDIYGILLKTGKYINVIDIIYLKIKILFLFKII